jgi:hypothetical protein
MLSATNQLVQCMNAFVGGQDVPTYRCVILLYATRSSKQRRDNQARRGMCYRASDEQIADGREGKWLNGPYWWD